MELKKITFNEKDDVKKEGVLDWLWERGWQKCGFDCTEWFGNSLGNAGDSTKPCHSEKTQKLTVWN